MHHIQLLCSKYALYIHLLRKIQKKPGSIKEKTILQDGPTVFQGSYRQNGRNFTTVRALTRIFHDMNLTVVAEGAETQDEVEALTDIGVDRIQGYVFARPMPLKELLLFYGDKEQT
jgi:hypothetical protein